MEILPLIDNEETRALVRRLSEREFGAPGALTSLGGGSFGLCWRVDLPDGAKKAIKAFRVAGMNRTQALQTELLSRASTIPFPATLFVSDPDEEIPLYAMGMEFVGGEVAASVNPYFRSPVKRRAMADAVVTALLRINAQKNDRFGFVENAVFPDWLSFYRPLAEETIRWVFQDPAKRGLRESVVRVMDTAFCRFDKIFAEPGKEANLVHSDLNVCNIMIDPKTLKPTALIDPFGSVWGDREYELHELLNMTGLGFYLYETYKKRYPVSELCDLKCAFYALFNEVRCYMLSGVKFDFIFPKQVGNLNRQMKKFGILK